jgi:hypothetical protein
MPVCRSPSFGREPGGEFIEETATVVHGPHPGFGEDFPFCEIAAELTGA